MTETRRLTLVWLVLSAVTVVTWLLGHAERSLGGRATSIVALVVLVIAFVKVRLIISHFMDVRTGPTWLRLFADVWLLVVGGTITALYLF